jgi:hypothetical protein
LDHTFASCQACEWQYVLQLGSEHKSGLSWGLAGLGYVACQPGRGADGWHLTWQSL